ncbi:MAG TPA: hypothetical protein VF194_19680 [Ferrovibrio sp.]|uniref:hypothetical protein n=1 Tax=Ferrovibrio sp. TaxID=1917215 RepID=UPI002ECFD1E6
MSAELISALAAIGTVAFGLGGIIYRLGAIHADLRGLVRIVRDHEHRLRAIEAGE